MSSPIDTSTGAPATLDALAAAGEHAGWRVLDAARAQQFTGEIVFEAQPNISVYLDTGHAYYAFRAGDPSLCQRLIDADVIEPAQIERGVIRVGNVENLGRLFDRDPSVDRDAVMVLLELVTDDVVTAVANTITSSFTLTAYRHHASGVHRWFVAPSDQQQHVPAQLAPVGEVAQIDASVTSDLPGLPGLSDDLDDGVHIEWDQPLGHDDLDAPTPRHSLDDSMLQSLLDAPVDPAASNAPPAPLAPPASSLAESASAAPIDAPSGDSPFTASPDQLDNSGHDTDEFNGSADNFQIVWPDGSEQSLIGPDADVADTTPEHDIDAALADHSAAPEPEASPAPAVLEVPVEDAPVNTTIIVPADEVIPPAPEPTPELVPAPFSFELPALAVSDDNLPEDHQPEEVVDAVRRALEAIESALATPTVLPSVAVADLPSFEPTTPLEFDIVDPSVVTPNPSDMPDQLVDIEPAPAVASTVEADVDVAEPVTESVAEPAATSAAASALELALPPQTEVAVVAEPVVAEPVDAELVVEAAPAPLTGFAPPTMNDSAEAVYARAAEDAVPAGPASGVASVVFVDEEPADDTDRSGALKRLIGSLRRK